MGPIYRLTRLLKLSNEIIRIKEVKQAPAEEWSDDDGHLVIVGDAAHHITVCTSISRFKIKTTLTSFHLFIAYG